MRSDFVNNLDRSALGTLVVPVEVLTAMDILHRHIMQTPSYYQGQVYNYIPTRVNGSDEDDEEVMDLEAHMDDLIIKYDVNYDTILGELFYWWRLSGDYDLNSYINSGDANKGALGARIAYLALAAEHPEKVPYFSVGILDTDQIDKFIESGVDPELARSLAGA